MHKQCGYYFPMNLWEFKNMLQKGVIKGVVQKKYREKVIVRFGVSNSK